MDASAVVLRLVAFKDGNMSLQQKQGKNIATKDLKKLLIQERQQLSIRNTNQPGFLKGKQVKDMARFLQNEQLKIWMKIICLDQKPICLG